MKKLFSITLISILLLNIFGYYGAFLGLKYRNELLMKRALDLDLIHESEAITVKVPMSVPYMPDQPGFEKVNGKFEYNGELYRLVKQRYARDTLTVVCIKDAQNKKINQVLSEYAKAFADVSGQHKSTKVLINFLKEFVSSGSSIQRQSAGWAMTLYCNSSTQPLLGMFSRSIAQPPEGV